MNKKKSFDELRKKAEEILSRADNFASGSKTDLSRLFNELDVHRVELELQNEELIRAQKDLENSRDEYFSLYDSAPVAYVTLDTKGLISRYNRKAAVLFYSERLFINRAMTSLIYREDWPIFFNLLTAMKPGACELRVLGKEGRVVHTLMGAAPGVNREDGSPIWFMAFNNFTEKKQAEAEALMHNRLYEGIGSIFESVVRQETDEKFGSGCLSVAEGVTESSISFIRITGPDGEMCNLSVSNPGWNACPMNDKEGRKNPPREFHMHGIYSSVLLEGKSLISNDPASHPDRVGLPVGHPPLESFMGAPLKHGERIAGIIGVGNRRGGYGSREQKALEILASTISDALGRRCNEKALAESEERLRVVTEGGNLGTWDRDLITGKFVCNSKLYEFIGRNPDDPFIDEKEWLEYIYPDDLEPLLAHTGKTIRTGKELYDEFRIIREDGDIRWLAVSARVYKDGDNRPVRMAGVNFDISGKKWLEIELSRYRNKLEIMVQERTFELNKLNEEYKKEIEQRRFFEQDLRLKGERIIEEQTRRKYLSGKLVEMIEKERKEMAHTLHDEVGQALVTIKTDLDFLKENKDGCSSEVVDEIEQIQDRIRGMMEYFSKLSHSLTPHIIQDLGLVPAVESLFENIREKSDLKVHFYTKGIPDHISDQKDLAIYRIVQEGVTNCLKYAEADHLYINMVIKGNSVLVTIEDDGVGFENNSISDGNIKREKLGLTIMNERAVQAGGEFHIESMPGKGTQIIVEIPLR